MKSLSEKYSPASYIDSIKSEATRRAKELIKKESFQREVMNSRKNLSEQYDNIDQTTPWFNREYVKQLLNTFSVVTCPSCNYDDVVNGFNTTMTDGADGQDSYTGSDNKTLYRYDQKVVSYANDETGGNDGEY